MISLHGDAFRRSGARAKTSIIYLIKKRDQDEAQQGCFVYESRYIGRDDVPPKTRASDAENAKNLAINEMENIVSEFNLFLQGIKGTWIVSPDKLNGRLDAKHLLPYSVLELEKTWKKVGADSKTIENLFDPIKEEIVLDPDTRYKFLRITYEGKPEVGDTALGKEVSYTSVFSAQKNDIVISNINAINKAVCVMPEGMEDLLISQAFTVLRLKATKIDTIDPMYICSILRTSAVVAEWLSHTTGFGRHYVDWNLIRNQRIPLLPYEKQKHIGNVSRELIQFEKDILFKKNTIASEIANLGLEDDRAKDKLASAKPPR